MFDIEQPPQFGTQFAPIAPSDGPLDLLILLGDWETWAQLAEYYDIIVDGVKAGNYVRKFLQAKQRKPETPLLPEAVKQLEQVNIAANDNNKFGHIWQREHQVRESGDRWVVHFTFDFSNTQLLLQQEMVILIREMPPLMRAAEVYAVDYIEKNNHNLSIVGRIMIDPHSTNLQRSLQLLSSGALQPTDLILQIDDEGNYKIVQQ